jgi:hypothetical protein
MRVPRQFVVQRPLSIFLDPLWLGAGSDPENERGSSPGSSKTIPKSDDLPYRIELWDVARQTVERILAITARSAISYAAYYAAVKEYPDRLITLRHQNRTIARSHETQSDEPKQ